MNDAHRFHPIVFVIVPFIWIIACLFNTNVCLASIIAIYINALIVIRSIKYYIIFRFVLFMIPVMLSMFITSYIFVKSNNNIAVVHIFKDYHLHYSIYVAICLMIRVFALSFISLLFVYHMPKTELLTYLMSCKILPVSVGYAFLAVFNASVYLKNEFNRIQIAYRMRYCRYNYSLSMLIPLLVAAARYAHQLSISLHSRGLSNDKSYIATVGIVKIKDLILIIINILAVCYLI